MKFTEMLTYVDYCDGCGVRVGQSETSKPWSAPSG